MKRRHEPQVVAIWLIVAAIAATALIVAVLTITAR